MKKLFLFSSLLLWIIGCSTFAGLQPGEGQKIITDKSKDQVWAAAMEVVKKRNFEISESDKEKGIIKAMSGVSGWSWGELIGIFIYVSEKNSSRIVIEVVSNSVMKTNVTAKNWAPIIISDIREELGILN
jgi:hypothetical protein